MMAKQKGLNAQIDEYYRRLDEFAHQYVLHESATSVAFQSLLAEAARPNKWTLIPQLPERKAGRSIDWTSSHLPRSRRFVFASPECHAFGIPI
jgi:hypothetical protein